MAVFASFGLAQALEAADAASKAAHYAMRGMGKSQPALAILLVTHQHSLEQAASGAALVLGDTPMFGFSTSALLSANGASERGVAVALLAGSNLQARAGWWPGFSEDGRDCTGEMLKVLQPDPHLNRCLLLAAEGFSGDPAALIGSLHEGLNVAGCLAGGDLQAGRTYQLGGKQTGSGGLAGARLEGCRASSAAEHGWNDIGAYAQVTRARGVWLRTLDGKPAAETYARLFGFTEREWSFPPLNHLIRIYPLNVEPPNGGQAMLRAAMRVEADGGMRMNTAVAEGSIVHFMLGSLGDCVQAARRATQKAMDGLGATRPVLALLFVDAAWQSLTQAQPGAEVEAVRQVLGADIPIIGGYTYGQFTASSGLLNAHLQVTVFGE